ncbi:uncharacterized protein LOC134253831 [Saccostrea cucullata]|uniref:uncharacterized protein LOC134253831 n=1 Tax=Saccostrea cuccullata TaxID=36930 RepID=UPI002ED66C92
MVMEHQAKMNEKFRKYRDDFIERKIQSVWEEHALGTDHVDRNNAKFKNRLDERYSFVVSHHPQEPPSVVMGEPCFQNPCSYDAIDEVFSHISDLTMAGDRKWTILGCDALPYTLGSRLIESSFLCPTCHREFLDAQGFQKHQEDSEHATNARLEDCKKFKNVLLIPGLGHYEINMVKCIFGFLWKVAFEDLGKMLGFKSATALASLRACADHHKSWQTLQIFLHAMSEELITPYVRHCKSDNLHPSLAGYYGWLQSSQPTALYEFMREVVFTYCLSIHVFRAGVRRNNTDAINCSKAKFAPLFFGLNMPFYMETYIRDSLTRLQCPPEVLAFIERHESYSVTGNDSKGEGGDFVLEAKNRETKRLVPSGVPTNQMWTNICRNVDRLGQVLNNY